MYKYINTVDNIASFVCDSASDVPFLPTYEVEGDPDHAYDTLSIKIVPIGAEVLTANSEVFKLFVAGWKQL